MIAPRLGLAWDPWGDGNTAIRVGGGEFFQRERVSRYTLVANAPFAITASYTRALDGRRCRNCIPVRHRQVVWITRDTVPVSWQWNVSIQRSLARDTTLELGYVGNHAYHQTSSFDLNQIAPQNWLAASFLSNSDAQKAGFFAFNNYDTSLTFWTHQGDATYNASAGIVQDALQTIAVDRGLYLVTLDRERHPGRFLGWHSDSRASRCPRIRDWIVVIQRSTGQ